MFWIICLQFKCSLSSKSDTGVGIHLVQKQILQFLCKHSVLAANRLAVNLKYVQNILCRTAQNDLVRIHDLVHGKDAHRYGNAVLITHLQHRVEDAKGNITAYRVGTAYKKFTENVSDWINGEQLEIFYGDASTLETYGKGMELRNGDGAYYAFNSKGDLVPVEENQWASPDMTPTHVIIWISSSSGPSYCGGVENILWIDNVKFVEE